MAHSLRRLYMEDLTTAVKLISVSMPRITPAILVGPSREHILCVPRHVAAWWLRELADASYPILGQVFGGRHHTTMMHACRAVDAEIRIGRGERARLLIAMIGVAALAVRQPPPPDARKAFTF